jgi:hypothetical protein
MSVPFSTRLQILLENTDFSLSLISFLSDLWSRYVVRKYSNVFNWIQEFTEHSLTNKIICKCCSYFLKIFPKKVKKKNQYSSFL